MPPLILRTPRLTLRPFRPADRAALERLLRELEDRSLFEAGGRRLSPARLAAKILRESGAPDRGHGPRPVSLGVFLKGGRAPVGGARVCPDSEGDAELALWLAPGCRGRGLGREALDALLRLGFGVLGCTRLHAGCDAGNAAARRLLEAGGLRPLCTLEGEDARGRPTRRILHYLARP